MKSVILFLSLLLIASPGLAEGDSAQKNGGKSLAVTFKTTKGDISIDLHEGKTPLTVANFLNLSKRGYYNGLSFHRVIDDFMVQGGDPDGTGSGGPGYTFKDEFDSSLKHDKPGILSMANRGPATNGSQFFITHVPTPWLDGKHTVFGEVTSGLDVVNAIVQGDKINEVVISGDADSIIESHKAQVDEWNSTLDKK